jgi:hypothetical protein
MKNKSRGAWPDWIESEEGKRCANPTTLNLAYRQSEFLENRLWTAFTAGYQAGGQMRRFEDEKSFALPRKGFTKLKR